MTIHLQSQGSIWFKQLDAHLAVVIPMSAQHSIQAACLFASSYGSVILHISVQFAWLTEHFGAGPRTDVAIAVETIAVIPMSSNLCFTTE
jgi:hypothetical protein